MVREDGKRNFVLREDGAETSVFSGDMPRQAALKAARRLDPNDSEAAAESDPTELRLREKGTDKIHVYEGWAWTDDAPEDTPGWMDGEITRGNVSKRGIEHIEE
jgi:hypothetical protein